MVPGITTGSAVVEPLADAKALATTTTADPTANPTPKVINGHYQAPQHGPVYEVSPTPLGTIKKMRIITIGAGASGINMAYQTKKHLKNVSLVVYEKNADVGGTWTENRYPGCKCDIPQALYSLAQALNMSTQACTGVHRLRCPVSSAYATTPYARL
ncbi:hypothetical protein SPBR_03289 [Sporothrix brasiliensis 5110]|uniref:Uncharacterized protein n=1 Tax=Sporothrix brasiliensis 5110 TaxID=1398154 RepID=A0A0C2FM70_9PEZI|nr:uncharacterized protein SPBR_03289 [Sporothrix brasiliensis 5110]KIH92133.1 hypothetical protein SPBR_03289 [Sporothrix brasiliensis 5110]